MQYVSGLQGQYPLPKPFKTKEEFIRLLFFELEFITYRKHDKKINKYVREKLKPEALAKMLANC